MKKRLSHEQFKCEALSNSMVKNEYDALEQEFKMIATLIKRKKVTRNCDSMNDKMR